MVKAGPLFTKTDGRSRHVYGPAHSPQLSVTLICKFVSFSVSSFVYLSGDGLSRH